MCIRYRVRFALLHNTISNIIITDIEYSLFVIEDINILTPMGGTVTTVIGLSSDLLSINSTKTNVNNLAVKGRIEMISGLNVGTKLPISFTTNRNININGTTFSCYDIDLTKYVKSVTLDGYNIRQFRLRSWLADADFQGNNSHQLRYDIYMSNRGGLSIYAFAVPFDNEYLDNSKWSDHFFYRNDFNRIMYCARFGTPKVYCIIEDLL